MLRIKKLKKKVTEKLFIRLYNDSIKSTTIAVLTWYVSYFLAQLNQLNQQNGINGHPGTTSELEVVRIVELLDPADQEDGKLLDSQNNDIKHRLRSASKSSNEDEQSEKDSDSLLDKENVSWKEKVDAERKEGVIFGVC